MKDHLCAMKDVLCALQPVQWFLALARRPCARGACQHVHRSLETLYALHGQSRNTMGCKRQFKVYRKQWRTKGVAYPGPLQQDIVWPPSAHSVTNGDAAAQERQVVRGMPTESLRAGFFGSGPLRRGT